MAQAKDKVNHFYKLAPELVELIAKAASARALRSLRLTSRKCAANVLKTYAEAHFGEITLHIHDEKSIEKCLKICKEAKFSSAVRSLVIVLDRCDRYKTWRNRRWCKTDHRHVKRGATLQRDPDLDAGIETWLDNNDDWAALHILFNELARVCKRLTKLRIVGQPVRNLQISRHYQIEYYDPWNEWVCACVPICLLRCLEQSHLRRKLSALEIGTEDEGTPDDRKDPWRLPITELNASDLQLLQRILPSMQSLSVSLWAKMPSDGNSRGPIDETEPLMIILRSLESSAILKHLSLTFAHWPPPVVSTWINLKRLHFSQLESLRWGGSYCQRFQVMELADFISAHQPTLRHVELGMMSVCPHASGPFSQGIEDKATFKEGIAVNLRRLTGLEDISVQEDTEKEYLDWEYIYDERN